MGNVHDFDILNLEIKTNNSTNTLNLVDDLKINSEDLNEGFMDQPAKYAYWATVASQAQQLVDKKKLEVDRQEEYLKKTLVGELDEEVRQELEMNGERITESKVTNNIYIHPRYSDNLNVLYDLKQELLDLQGKYAALNIAKDAMNQRKDMLISLGAQMRNENANMDLIIKKANSVISSNRK